MYKNSTKKANSCALHPNLRSSSPLPIREYIPIALRDTKMVKQSQEKDHEDPMRIRCKKTHYVLPARENAYHTLVIDFHFGSNWWRGWRAQNVKTNKKARLGYI